MPVGVIVFAAQALVSSVLLAARRPWTSYLARLNRPREVWGHPVFHKANMVITAAWTAYFWLGAGLSFVGPRWTPVAFWLALIPAIPFSFVAGDRYSKHLLTAASARSHSMP